MHVNHEPRAASTGDRRMAAGNTAAVGHPRAPLARRGDAAALVLAMFTIAACPTFARGASILFDGATGTLPAAQGWSYLASGPNATQTASAGYVTLDTTAARTEAAGYFTHNVLTGAKVLSTAPALDRTTGFDLDLSLRVVSEGHNNRDDNNDGKLDRAGFSLIAITSDLLGIEIGFFQDRVWAYADGLSDAADWFTQAEGAAFDTTAATTDYHLRVLGSDYELYAGTTKLFGGALRNYTSYSVFPDPYDKANMIFVGDDTGSADSKVQIAQIACSPVPEPGTLLAAAGTALALAAASFAARRRTTA